MLPAPLRLLRPGDWIKNAFVVVPLIFYTAGTRMEGAPLSLGQMFVATLLTVVAFCLAGSGFYCVNDALDFAEDRLHPVKRRRPVASGAIAPRTAAIMGVILVAAGMLVAWKVSPGVQLTVTAYVLLQIAYNVKLKRVRFIDVATVASGFVLRSIAGAMAIQAAVSIWLVVVVFALTLYLGFVKRLADIRAAQLARDRGEGTSWKPRAGYDSVEDLNWLLSVTGSITVLAYLMYALSDHARLLFQARAFGFALLMPLVLVVIHRMYLRANRGQGDSPITAMLEDRTARTAAMLFVTGVLVTLYWSPVAEALGRTFQ